MHHDEIQENRCKSRLASYYKVFVFYWKFHLECQLAVIVQTLVLHHLYFAPTTGKFIPVSYTHLTLPTNREV